MDMIYTVSEITTKIKQVLENNFNILQIRGEVSNYKLSTNGHIYFSLKDTHSIISCVSWKSTKHSIKIENGLEIIATGILTIYKTQSKYQIVVKNCKYAGVGALMQLYEQRKQKFSLEGLFDKKHKQKLPFLPHKIAIITSQHGAVISDIINRILDRCEINILLFPVSVQGNQAASEIINAIEQANLSTNVETIIIARGGGSIEDLWCFNDELLIKTVYRSKIPIISAIGHERDWTLLDYVADVRAATPTMAAEIITPVKVDLYHLINIYMKKICQQLYLHISKDQKYITSKYQQLYYHTINVFKHYQYKLQNFTIAQLIKNKTLHLQQNLHLTTQRLSNIKFHIKQYKTLINQIDLYKLAQNYLINKLHQLQLLEITLNSFNIDKILSYGFAIIKHSTKNHYQITTSIKDINENLIIKMHDGEKYIQIINSDKKN